jgi:hypothetical protein
LGLGPCRAPDAPSGDAPDRAGLRAGRGRRPRSRRDQLRADRAGLDEG